MSDRQAVTEEQKTPTPVNAPGRNEMPVENRAGAETSTGSSDYLSWGARSDVGLVRPHNEDSFLVRAPLFVVCDGMGGRAAGEVASRIAVDTIGEEAPEHADDVALGAAVEAANAAVLDGAQSGQGKPGMGCTATCAIIEKNRMSVAHVGDSRIYLLHHGTLVRVTHDHSYVEELVDAGEITADEARVHPSRSIITRALGSDPDMYADHFTLNVSSGDRVIICSDGLSSMVPDKEIESLAVSCATAQSAADTLVSAALTAGGHDNVTVVVIDVTEDGIAEEHRRRRRHGIVSWVCVLAAALVITGVVMGVVVSNSWYVGNNDGTVGIYRGTNDEVLGLPLSTLIETSSVQVKDLPETTQHQLDEGIHVSDEEEAKSTVERYRDQIDADKTKAAEAAAETESSANTSQQDDADTSDVPEAESGDATPAEAAATAQQQQEQAEAAATARQQQAKNESDNSNANMPASSSQSQGSGE